MNLTSAQNKAVENLVETTKSFLKQEINYNAIYFKAPTGSGKTFMMLNYIDELIQWNKFHSNHELVFVIVTLSSAELPKQMEESFDEYKQFINNSNLEIFRIESPSNLNRTSKIDKNYQFFSKPDSIYIMGGASFKSNSILREQGAIELFLAEIKRKNQVLIYIRDEAHIGSSVRLNEKEKSFETQMQANANFILKMTATPKTDLPLIELSEKDLEEDNIQLLKNKKEFNFGLKSGGDYSNEEILQIACEKFNKIKEKYNDDVNEPGLKGINPAMLIQIDNDSEKDIAKREIFEKNIKTIIKIIEKNNLSWVKYFDKNKKESSLRQKENFSLRDISKNISSVDVIIFKIGPATGWNIPRACMLVQLRNISSTNLSIQTIGRIKRNPNPEYNFLNNSIALKYFIYSNLDQEDKTVHKLFLKDKYKDYRFISGNIEYSNHKNNSKNIVDIKQYEKNFLDKFRPELDKFKTESIQKSKFYVSFESLINKYKQQWEGDKFIIAGSEKFGSGTLITRKISNIIELEIFLIKLKNNLKKYLTQQISNFFAEIKAKLIQKHKINSQILEMILLSYFRPEFIGIYNDTINSQIKNEEIKYKLSFDEPLPEQIEFGPEGRIIEPDEYFGYRKIGSKNKKDELLLDSEAEKFFANELIKINKQNEKINFWAKNSAYGKLGFQYIKVEQIAQSYPDFLVRKGNHFFYFEIKNYNDFDPSKTKLLIEHYQKYLETHINNQINLTLVLCWVKTDTKELYFAGSSTLKELKELIDFNLSSNSKEEFEKKRKEEIPSQNLAKFFEF
ncbi:DEAD/DEAH box helicase family protein [Mycoplasma sp. 'Moose RK']|uniref:DEAD/DEAH box helicase family protein n=1 Tax=Mycoplasma sp. 'Moose RK' TaxID=2780095 RepID=UPI0018C29790|nr:DEAD/DEAH box helicase family protein [Mycoplasma sp. 'Moose RK']MBG0730538.1 DEAD/DEAH box helicase family protein [Mycoplasma sp. 'Moose RK']MBG0730757.1 DEAD/DEAH box helicase family protein [Mycoplasma sp. 'Moose RK']